MADNSIGQSFQRILFWNNFVTEKLSTELTDCPEVKEEEVEDEQCCIDLSSPWISCGAVAAGEPLTDPLSLEEDQASGRAVEAGAAEVSSGALAAVKHLADTLIPQGSREANEEKLFTARSVEQEDSRRADHSPDHVCPLSARLRGAASLAGSATRDQTGEPPGPHREPHAQSSEHVKKKRYTCSACGKAFGKPIYLSLHTCIHEAPRPYSCDSCDRSFETRAQFLSHPCVHSDGGTYRCPSCERTFWTQQSLMSHLHEHWGERPFSCSVCGLAFWTQFNLDLHVRTHAGGSFGGRPYRGPFACSVCGELFKRKAQLTYHERSSCMLGVYAPYLKLYNKVKSKLAAT